MSRDPAVAAARGIVTARLVLEPLSVDHAAEMVHVLADPRLYDVTGGEPPTQAQLVETYQAQITGPGRPKEAWRNWVVRHDDDAVGYVQATLVESGGRWVAYLAWLVDTAKQGRGFATEAAAAVVDELVSAGVAEIRCAVAEGHHASEAVARRLAMTPTSERTDEGERVWVRGLVS